MKTFFAAALLAASAIAAETNQAVLNLGTKDEVKVDDMWTNDMIKDHVDTNFGNPTVEWDDFAATTLMNADATQQIAGSVAASIVNQWETGLTHLPNVCDPGVKCRKEIFEKVTTELQEKWATMFDEIVEKLSTRKVVIDAELVKFYTEAYECDPGCTCDNIRIEYDQLLRW